MTKSKQPVLRKDKTGSHTLETLYFYLSEGCNLACSHCWLSPVQSHPGESASFLPFDLFEKIVHEAAPLGLTGVKLTGGEPLLHPDIHAILDFIYEKNLDVTIETNGTLCTPQLVENIARQRNPFVSVSLDAADAATHDKLRGKQGAYQKTTQCIKALTGKKIPTQIIMTLMRRNVDQIEDMIALAAELGVESLKFNILQPIGRGHSMHASDRAIPLSELIDLAKRVETEFEPITDIKLFFDCPPAFKSLRKIAPGAEGCFVCGIFSILGVLADGSYALCGIGSQVEQMVFGHAGEDLLEDVWLKNPTLQEIHQGLPEKLTGICRRCLMKSHCLGSCIAQNYYSTNSIWAPFWFCDQAEKLGFFPRSRLH